MPDPVYDRLVRAPVPNAVRHSAWDAFDQATDADDLARRLKDIKLPDAVKHDLWNLKESTAPVVRQPDFTTTNQKDVSGKPIVQSLKDFGSEATAGINPRNINNAIQSAFWHPIETVKAIGAAQAVPGQKAIESFKEGDYVSAARHAAGWALPIIGPRLDQAGDYMQEGEYAKGLGATVDVGTQIALPSVGKIPFNGPRLVSATKNAAEAAANRFGRQRGIPIDAGTATGSQFVKNVQKRAGSTWGGANVAETAQAKQGTHLARVGDDLSAEVHPSTVQPVQAGEGVRGELAGQIKTHATTADTKYGTLRQKEAANPEAFYMDLADEKAALNPYYLTLKREADLVPLQGDKARVLTSLDRLMNSYEASVPLSIVDEALGDLKSLARADNPALRTQGQGIAAQMVTVIDAKVRATAKKAGVLDLLEEGRAATTAKYQTADVLDLLRDEPRGVFDQLTMRKDGGIEKLRAVAKLAPDEVPKLGRALLEDMLDKPTSEGGFKFADKARADWERIGPQTRSLLFGSHASDIDNFFLLAKKIGENPNPSGTAQVLTATQLLVGIPGYVLARILYSPKAVKSLTTGLKVSANAGPTAKAIAAAQVARAAKEAGVVLPLAADEQIGQP